MTTQDLQQELIFHRQADKRWWLRSNGTVVRNKMPGDMYHFQRYTAKGWQFAPKELSDKLDALGVELLPYEDLDVLFNTPISPTVRETGPAVVGGDKPRDLPEVKLDWKGGISGDHLPKELRTQEPHSHRFGKEMGAPCKEDGCLATRQIAYQKRQPKWKRLTQE